VFDYWYHALTSLLAVGEAFSSAPREIVLEDQLCKLGSFLILGAVILMVALPILPPILNLHNSIGMRR